MEKPMPPQEPHPVDDSTNNVHDQPPSYDVSSHGALRSPPLSPPISEREQQPPQGHIPQQGGLPPQQGNYGPQQGNYGPQQGNYGPQANMGCVPLQMLRSQSAPVLCPSCGVRSTTVTTQESGGFTHGVALLVCFVSCLGCIPYCISSLKDVHHKCGNCGIPLAHYHRSGRTDVLAYPK